MVRQSILIIIALLFGTMVSVAQQMTIKGVVLDVSTHKAIEGVEIINAESGAGTITDKAGKFTVPVLGNKGVKLSFQHLGYELKIVEVNSFLNQETAVVLLKPKTTSLDEFSIIGQYENERPYRIEHLDQNTIEQSQANDVGDLLRQEPNVSGVRKGASGIDPVIRGAKYAQLNVVLSDGIKIEGGCPNRMDPATAHVELSDLRGITILKGPFALKYGPNFGGVIKLQNQHLLFYPKYETHITALMGTQSNQTGFKSKLGINGGGNRLAYELSGNWKRYGDYMTGDDEIVRSSLEKCKLAGKIGFKPADGHTIELGMDRSWGRNIDFPALAMDERSDDTHIYNLDYLGSDLGKTVNFIRAKLYRSDVHHIMDNKNRPFSDTVVAISDIRASNWGGRFGINLNVGKGRLEIGGDYEQIDKDGERNKYLIRQPNLPKLSEDLWNEARIQNTGMFVEYQKQGYRIDWVVAGRVDFNKANSNPLLRNKPNGDPVYANSDTKSNYTNFSVSGGLSWHLGTNSDLLFSLGSGTRSPDMTERFIILLPIGYDPYDYLGNPQLKPETNNEIDLGYRFTKSNVGRLNLSGFFSLANNYIYSEILPPSEQKPQTPGVLGVKRFVNIDYVYFTGFELSYFTPEKFRWQLYLDAAYTLGVKPSAGTNDPLPEIPPFESNLKFQYRFFNERFVPEIRLRMVAAQKRISVDYNETPSEAFTTLDFNLFYLFGKYLKVRAGVTNVFNTSYYEHLNRNQLGSQIPLYEMGRSFYLNLTFNL